MKDLVDREAIWNGLIYAHPIGFNNDDIAEAFKNAPTIYATEVVRCRDCKAWGKSPWGHFRMGWCKIHGCHHAPDYFCASAKKREAKEVE